MSAAQNRALGAQTLTHLGLLVLRAAALFLVITIGWEKFWGLVSAIHAGKPLASSGLAPLLTKMGFPVPTVLAVSVALIESVAAFLVALGLFTRWFALCGACSMAGAFYTSMHFGWEPIRSFIYMFFFLALVFSGAGKYSFDFRWLKTMRIVPQSIDAGLLVLRLGLLASIVMLLTAKAANGHNAFAHGRAGILLACAAILAAPVILGCFVRIAAILSLAFWAWAAMSGLIAGQRWDLAPYRGILFVFLFLTLALTGPGRFSWRNARRT